MYGGRDCMSVNGTLMNYYFHCKRQCYLHGNRLNLEEKAADGKNTELAIDNIRLDKLTKEYLTEIKKSDADVEAARWQLLYYLKVLKTKGVIRKGRLEFVEKNKTDKKIVYVELTEDNERQLEAYIKEIEELIHQEKVPECLNKSKCKKCAYYEYCYI